MRTYDYQEGPKAKNNFERGMKLLFQVAGGPSFLLLFLSLTNMRGCPTLSRLDFLRKGGK